jgi:DNA primase
VKLLRGFIGQNGKALLVYDSDEAGLNAARRSIAVFDNAFVNAQILVLQEGHDPDSYINAFGIGAFTEAAASASGTVAFLLESAVRKHGLTTEGKLRIVSELLQSIASVDDAVARSLHIRMIAERLDIKEDAVAEKLNQVIKRPSPPNRFSDKAGIQRPPSKNKNADAHLIERRLIAMMLQFPDMIAQIESEQALDYFENEDLQKIGTEAIRCFKAGADKSSGEGHQDSRWISEVVDRVDDRLKGLVAHLADTEDSWSHDGCRMLIGQFLSQKKNRRSSQTLEARIKEAEAKQDERLVQQLLIEKQKLAVQRSKQQTAMLENS